MAIQLSVNLNKNVTRLQDWQQRKFDPLAGTSRLDESGATSALGHDLPIICSASLSFEWMVRIWNLPNGLRWHPGYSRRRGSEPSI